MQSRYVIDHNYKWFVYMLFGYLDISWACWLLVLSIAFTWEEYTMSYGQVWPSLCVFGRQMLTKHLPLKVSAILAVVPTFCVTIGFIYSHRRDILDSLRRLPNRCSVGAQRWLTRKKPDLPAQDHHLPFNVAPYPEKPAVGKLPGQIAKNLQSTHRPPLLPELDYEMWGRRKQDMRYCACSGATPVDAVCDRV